MTKPGRKSSAELAIVSPLETSRCLEVDAVSPEPPAHLAPQTADWWRSVVRDFDLEPHHLRLLQSAGEAWDRMQQARQALADHGSLTFTAASGDLKTHPCVAVERDARIAFARLIRELDLDTGAPAERSRPPAIGSNRR